MNELAKVNRRQFITLSSVLSAGLILPNDSWAASAPILKPIAKTAEQLPVIGLGTSVTFDAVGDTALLEQLAKVIQMFFDMGGGMIDSSPMYGSAEQVIGQLLQQHKDNKNLFSSTKVWTEGKQQGIEQMATSRQLWGGDSFDLMQIHNLVDWRTHLETLKQMKADKQIRYIGITTSHGRNHKELEDILTNHEFDFLQLSYNMADREVESKLLPIAQDKGIAVIANRPYQRGNLFSQVKGKPLPKVAMDINCTTWGQFFLKYVVSHPAVNCVIPATTKVKHLQDNMLAGRGPLPTAQQRTQMLAYFESI